MRINRNSTASSVNREIGFTLVELMITVAIIGILAAIIIPSYSQYTVKSKRAAAEGFIMSVTSKQQQYFLDARAYATSMASLGYTSSASIPSEVSKNYTVTLTADNTTTPPTYTVTATPIGSQLSRDTKCGAVSLDQSGAKNKTGTGTVADCW